MSLSAAPTFTPGSTRKHLRQQHSGGQHQHDPGPILHWGLRPVGRAGSTSTGSALSGRVQVINTGGGTIASTNGLQVQVFSTSDGGTTYDAVAFGGVNFVIPTTANVATPLSFDLPTGQYKIKFTNLDATNSITIEATLGTTA